MVNSTEARLVAGGNFVDARRVGETNAPTLNRFTVFFMLNVAVKLGMELLTVDIKGAYLIPDIIGGSEPDTYVWIEIKRQSTMLRYRGVSKFLHWVEHHSNAREYEDSSTGFFIRFDTFFVSI